MQCIRCQEIRVSAEFATVDVPGTTHVLPWDPRVSVLFFKGGAFLAGLSYRADSRDYEVSI